MTRVTIVHWAPDEAASIEKRLTDAGHRVRVVAPRGGAGIKTLAARLPDLFVIDLSRLPSHGRDVALWLRERKATRRLPLVFCGGETAKVERIRSLLPDAVYTPASRIKSAVRRALAGPPASPVAPATMAGYSGTPLPRKLGIKPGSSVVLVGAPPGFEDRLGPLPEDARVGRRLRPEADLVVLFAGRRAELVRRFAKVVKSLAPRGSVWIAWPKQASGVKTDLTQAEVRRYGLDRGLVDYKICAIDETWSGLRFARRRAPRATG